MKYSTHLPPGAVGEDPAIRHVEVPTPVTILCSQVTRQHSSVARCHRGIDGLRDGHVFDFYRRDAAATENMTK